MIISNFAIKHQVGVIILVLLILVLGLISYSRLPRESNPDIEIPLIFVSSFYEGASPEDIENLITFPLERKLKSLTDVKQMTSSSAEGASYIQIEFVPDVDIDSALQKVREKVNEAKGDLPADLEDDPAVREFSFNYEWPLMYLNVSGDVGLVKLKKIAEDIQEEIETVNGVLEAKVVGGLEREIRVEFDPNRIAQYRLTIAELLAAIRNNNLNTPSGSLDLGDAKYSIKVPGEFNTPEEITSIVIAVRDGRPIYLTDIADIRDTFKDRDSFARLGGVETVSIRITRRSGENLLAIADKCKAIGDRYQRTLPEGIRISYTSDGSKDVQIMVADLENNILSGLILVLAVIFLSLGFRNALMVSLAIPLSMLISFMALQFLGITLNIVVLFSLTLALGMLVDNAIVIIENIYRHHGGGKPLVRAAMEATAEVAWPVISSTMTTVVAFLPLVFWPGVMGEFMQYLPKTVIITLLSSLFVALVINPTLAAYFIKVAGVNRDGSVRDPSQVQHGVVRRGWIIRTYQRLLAISLKPGLNILTVLFFFGLLVFMIRLHGMLGLGLELFPDTEPRMIMVEISAPEGTNVYKTNTLAKQAEAIVRKYGNVLHVTTSVGAGTGQSGLSPNHARVVIDMVDRELRRGEPSDPADQRIYFRNSNDTMNAMRKELVPAIVGARVKVDKQAEGPPVGAPVNVEISGDNYQLLSQYSQRLQNEIKHIPGLVDLEDDFVKGLPEFRVDVDKVRAALLNLDVSLIGSMVKACINGLKVGDYREGEDEYDITARLPLELRRNLQDVLNIWIPDYNGNPVPLTSVARIVSSSGYGEIKHIDQKRVVTVSANVEKEQGYNSAEVLNQVRDKAGALTLPPGYAFNYTGENQEQEESQEFITEAFLWAVFLIALILVTQFNSVSSTLIIMTSVILSLLGVFFGLILLQKPFGIIMTGMGVISLAGVAVNNAIVLLDYIRLQREWGQPVREAVIIAGSTRFRPVMLTAITTILGLVPMAVGISFDFRQLVWVVGSDSAQWWGPMAVAVIFGLSVATVLTLLVVPSLYVFIEDLKVFCTRLLFARKTSPAPRPKAKPADYPQKEGVPVPASAPVQSQN